MNESRIKKTAKEIKQEMYDLGYTYYPAERVFKKLYDASGKVVVKLDEPIVHTWKEARDFCEIPE